MLYTEAGLRLSLPGTMFPCFCYEYAEFYSGCDASDGGVDVA